MPASPLLRRAVQAALLGARRTGGLADPTLLDAVEAAGYARSRVGVEPAPLEAALRAAPARRAATPGRRWREVEVREASIVRPPGLRIDLGGSAKGLAADWAASRLRGRFVVDCGGDVRVGGTHDVALRGTAHTLRVTDAAVATSGIDRRVWQRPDGSYAHHLLDPGTGEPAWTGVISATAIAATALEAEALAKAALLSGPRGARRSWRGGGIVVGEAAARGRRGAGGGRMTRDPMDYGWWLASRASGLVALALITLSVGVGLAMAGKAFRKPGLPRKLMALHEHAALGGLIAIAVHGITLLGDRWLHPGPAGIAVPFVMDYRPVYTGLGIVAGYLAAALGLSASTPAAGSARSCGGSCTGRRSPCTCSP